MSRNATSEVSGTASASGLDDVPQPLDEIRGRKRTGHAELVAERLGDEFDERRAVRFPAESADAPVGQDIHPAAHGVGLTQSGPFDVDDSDVVEKRRAAERHRAALRDHVGG